MTSFRAAQLGGCAHSNVGRAEASDCSRVGVGGRADQVAEARDQVGERDVRRAGQQRKELLVLLLQVAVQDHLERTGRRDGKFVEVLAGLAAGDVVLSNGQQGREGMVRTSPESPDKSNDRAALLGE